MKVKVNFRSRRAITRWFSHWEHLGTRVERHATKYGWQDEWMTLKKYHTTEETLSVTFWRTIRGPHPSTINSKIPNHWTLHNKISTSSIFSVVFSGQTLRAKRMATSNIFRGLEWGLCGQPGGWRILIGVRCWQSWISLFRFLKMICNASIRSYTTPRCQLQSPYPLKFIWFSCGLFPGCAWSLLHCTPSSGTPNSCVIPWHFHFQPSSFLDLRIHFQCSMGPSLADL